MHTNKFRYLFFLLVFDITSNINVISALMLEYDDLLTVPFVNFTNHETIDSIHYFSFIACNSIRYHTTTDSILN